MGWTDEIGPKTAEFLREFGPEFLKNYGIALLLKIKADAEKAAAKPDTRKLKYRGWDLVKPDAKLLMESNCWMKDGSGEGAFGGWTAGYLVQLADNTLALYGNASTAVGRDPKKAKLVIRPAGYQVVREVTSHFDSQAKAACEELECEKPEVGYSPYSWALVHNMRTNYIFQLHKGTGGGGCPCFGGGGKVEPADVGAENAALAEKWANVMQMCAANSSPRKLDGSVVAQAFDRTVKKLSLNSADLRGFADDGTEGQILAHMIFRSVFEAACKQDAQEQVKQAPFGRLAIWFKARGTAASIIEKAVDAGWGALQKQAEELTAKLEEKITPLVEIVFKKKAELQDWLKAQIGERIGQALSQLLGPILKEMAATLNTPMTGGVSAVLGIFEKEMRALCAGKALTGELPAEIASALDQVPRDPQKLAALDEASATLMAKLAQARQSYGEALASLKPRDVEAKFRTSLLKLLDAMVHSAQEDMRAGGSDAETAVLPDVLSRAKIDAAVVQKEFVSGFFVNLLLGQLKEHTREAVEPAIQSAQSMIPAEISDIIDLDAEYNTLLEITLGAAIAKAFEPK